MCYDGKGRNGKRNVRILVSNCNYLEEKRVSGPIGFRRPKVDVEALPKGSVDELVQRTLRADDAAASGRARGDELVPWYRNVGLRGSPEPISGKRLVAIAHIPLYG